VLGFDIFSIVVLLLALSVHESAHAWTADRLGDPTARNLGRVSLNPLVHADLFGTFLIPVFLVLAQSPVMFGWAKPVPVDTRYLQNPKRDYMLVAGAGPASNLLMAAGLFAVLLLIRISSPGGELLVNQAARGVASSYGLVGILASMAYTGILINLILAIFNLIPLAPLDGAAVLAGLLPDWLARPLQSIQSFGFVFLIALLYFGIPNYLFLPVIRAVNQLLTI
jgi:Zn-dependent protease